VGAAVASTADKVIDAATNPPITADLTKDLQSLFMTKISGGVFKALPIRKSRDIGRLTAEMAHRLPYLIFRNW
jgi:hypothetical protein